MEIPAWLKATAPADKGDSGPSVSPPFLLKTLRRILSFIKDTLFNREVSGKKGLLQGIGPKYKLAGTVILIVSMSLIGDVRVIALMLVVLFFAALLSRVPVGLLAGRILPVFLFTSIIAAPSALNVIVDGEGITTLLRLDGPHRLGPLFIPEEITVTKNGLLSAVTLVLRVTASATAVFIQTLTTPPDKLIKAVSFFLPGALKTIFSISYRYIFFLVRRLEEFVTAYGARNLSGSSGQGRRWAAFRMAALFSISLRLGRELETAMESRGCSFEGGGKASLREPRK